MSRYELLIVMGGLLGYVVSIVASTALVLLFFRLNARLLPGVKVSELFINLPPDKRLAPAVALGAATLCQAYLLRNAVFVVVSLAQDFLVNFGDQTLEGPFPTGPLLKLIGTSFFLLVFLSMLSVFSIWIAVNFFNWMTRGINELQLIADGNVAVAVLFAFVLVAITSILNEGIEDVSRVLVPFSRSGVIRLP